MMNVLEALKRRKSVRAFLDQPVETVKIEMLLQYARYAPSGVNMQPWTVCVVSGTKKREIETNMVRAFEEGIPPHMDYRYYPREWTEPYKSRRKAAGLLMYSTLGIARGDGAAQAEQWKKNYRAFGAPVVLYFFIDAALEKGSYLDYGMFLQSVMLSATALGLSTCPQAALAEYPDIVREALGVSEGNSLLCGMALGYEDTEAPVNGYRTDRVSVEEFTTFYE
jgi:nitroreductase